jgi:uncharacterized damage-inducible protein DinB
MTHDESLRKHLVKLLDWPDAHVSFDAAIDKIPAAVRGRVPDGLPWSLWQILEHLRLAQHDILDFCRNPQYEEGNFPDDYWPASAVPPSRRAWEESAAAFRKDLAALKRLARNRAVDLFARIPHGSGQTYLRELLLVADHNAYHIGQLVAVRRALGVWPA